MPPADGERFAKFEGAPKKNIPVELTLDKARALCKSYGSAQPVDTGRLDDGKPPKAPSVLVDAASFGGVVGAKPLVRHVLVKDLRKIASRGNIQLPRNGIFT